MIAVVVVVGSMNAPEKTSSGNSDSDDAPGWHDLVKDKKFGADNPGMLKSIAALIDKNGYDCPTLTRLWVKGPSPYGLRLEALCGPDDGKLSTYPQMHYAVYPEKFKINLCSEYGIFSKECT